MKKLTSRQESAGAFVRPIFKFLVGAVAVIAACGAYDVARNTKRNRPVLKRYFLGNGLLTCILSPLNTLLDLLALPYINRGVYQIGDLPKPYQAEIQHLIKAVSQDDVVGKLEEIAKGRPRTMIFFKWYGAKVESSIDIPALQEPYRYLQTIGVSIFNKQESTSKHFGPFRPTLRVLYNINQIDNHAAYIEVGNVVNYWKDNKLFIFDDTLMHQSFNESDTPRYCLFLDILRPSLLPGLFEFIVRIVQFCMRGVNGIFYKNWDIVKN